MGRSWRSKSTDWSGDQRRVDSGQVISRGALQTQKQRINPQLASESSCIESGSSYRYSASFGDCQGHPTYSAKSSIKQLLADEMSNEQKRRSPSIIARLMGFEGLSPQQSTHKQCPNHPVNSQYTYIDTRKPLKQQQHFKDVFEVSVPLKDEKRGYQSQRIATSELSKEDATFVCQKFLDANRFAADENFQGTKEFNDVEVLDSNKDLFLKLFQEPDSMFTKHLHDLRSAYPQSQSVHKVYQDPSGNQRYGTKDVETKLWKESSRNSSVTSRKKHKDSFYSTNIYDLDNPNWSKETDGKSAFPTRIVVLKPNFRKIQVLENESKVLSGNSISEFETSKMSRNVRIRNSEQLGKTQLSDGFQRPRHNAGESRELAKRITQKMRGSLRTGSLDFLLDGLQEYGADGSLCYDSGNDSSNGSEITSSRKSIASSNRKNRVSKSHFSGSSVNSEAKNRLSERWKMTQRFQEVGLSKSSTLGEMLSVPDGGKDSEIVVLTGNGSIKDGRLNRGKEQVNHLGISSRDGWRYDHTMRLSRSVSPPPSVGTPESTVMRKLSTDDRYLMTNVFYKDSNKAMEEKNFHRLESKDKRSRRSRSERSHSSNNADKNHSAENLELTSSDLIITPSCNDLPHEKDIMVLEMSACSDRNANLVIHGVDDAQHQILSMSSASTETFHGGGTPCLSNGQLPNQEMGTFNIQKILDEKSEGYTVPLDCLAVGLVSPGRSKETEQPSPMSVLAVPFPDDLSSGTECFESLTADLQGLRMQLQLLKQESAGYAEGYVAISSGENYDEDECTGVSEKRSLGVMDSLDSSYIVDALAISGFYDVDPYTYMATWHSLDYPMGPSEFEKLDEKYGEQAIWSRAEKRILFDLINTGLVEIFRQFLDSNPWVKQSQLKTVLTKDNDSLEGKLLKWLETQISQENGGNAAEKTIENDLEWNHSSCCIDQVGSEMEGLLTDELIAEMLEMW